MILFYFYFPFLWLWGEVLAQEWTINSTRTIQMFTDDRSVKLRAGLYDLSCQKAGAYPLHFELENLKAEKKDVIFRIQRSWDKRHTVDYSFSLEPNEKIRKDILVPYFTDSYNLELQIDVALKDEPLNSDRTLRAQADISERFLIVFSDADFTSNPSWIEDVNNHDYELGTQVHLAHSNQMPRIEGGYDTQRFMFVDAMLNLDTEQQQVLLSWVQLGGRLVIYNQPKTKEIPWTLFQGVVSPIKKDAQKLTFDTLSSLQREGLYVTQSASDVSLSSTIQRYTLGIGEIDIAFDDTPNMAILAILLDEKNHRDPFAERYWNNNFSQRQHENFGVFLLIVLVILIPIPFVIDRRFKLGFVISSLSTSICTIIAILLFSILYYGHSVYGDRFQIVVLNKAQKRFALKEQTSLFSNFKIFGTRKTPLDVYRYPLRDHDLKVEYGLSGRIESDGMLPSRKVKYFNTLYFQSTRLRIEHSKNSIQNAMDVPLQDIYLKDASGQLWYAQNIDANQSMPLKKVQSMTYNFRLLARLDLAPNSFVARMKKSPFWTQDDLNLELATDELWLIGEL